MSRGGARKSQWGKSANETVDMIKIVARDYATNKTPAQLATEFGVSVARVSAMATNLRGYGVDVAKMRKAGLYIRAIDELRKESPALFKEEKKRGRPAAVR